jgi:proteasome lid subunit RPN8/RPN11
MERYVPAERDSDADLAWLAEGCQIMVVTYPNEILAHSLDLLAEGGKGVRECVVLWLGRRKVIEIDIERVYMPAHQAASDFFYIDRHSMNDLKTYLRTNRLVVGAQVHTHPGEAFHSLADDEWAFVRHEGALSIVLPSFALHTSPATFMEDAAVYILSPSNSWDRIQGLDLRQRCVLKD